MTIRIVASGDQHIDARHMGRAYPGGHTALDDQRRALRALFDARHGADILALLGDSTHTRRPSPTAFEMWGEQLDRVGTDLDVVVVKGNHDDDDAIVRTFGRFGPRIHVATMPEVFKIRTKRGDEIDVAALPWLPDSHLRAAAGGARTKEEIAVELTRAAVDIVRGFIAVRRPGVPMILATHATIAGATTDGGWSMGTLPTTGYVLPVEELDRFDLVLAGHIHRHQSLPKVGRGPALVYTGSLLPLDFSETEPKGYVEALVDAGGATWSFVPLPVRPVRTLDLDGHGLMRTVRFVQAERGDIPEGALVRVRVKCSEAEAREYPASKVVWALTYGVAAEMVQVEYEIERADRARNAAVTAALSPIAALHEVYAGRGIDLDDQAHALEMADATLRELAQEQRDGGGGDLDVVRLEAEDFLGLAHASIDLDRVGVATICGAVGAGKSSIGCDVPRFALFGESRLGGKASERLIRRGADVATAAVELRGTGGERYRVVRKVKRAAGGRAVTTLDVLEWLEGADEEFGWRPLSTGKIADGEAAIARILGGLTDATATAANFVVQREADRFTRARPEERKRLIAEAAGLDVYDRLAEISAAKRLAAAQELERLHATAGPLRARADALPQVRQEMEEAQRAERDARARLESLEAEMASVARDADAAASRSAEYERLFAESRRLAAEYDRITVEEHGWRQRVVAAEAALLATGDADREKVLTAELERLATLQAQQVADAAQARDRAAALATLGRIEREVAELRRNRERDVARLSEQIEAVQRQEARLAASECPVIEQIRAGTSPACTFLRDAREDVRGLDDLARKLAEASEPSGAESDLLIRASGIVVPEESPTAAITSTAVVMAQQAVDDLRAAHHRAQVAAAQAEQIKVEATAALERLEPIRLDVQEQRAAVSRRSMEFGDSPRAELERLAARREEVDLAIVIERRRVEEHSTRAATLAGRIQALEEAAAELAALEPRIASTAVDVATAKQLVEDWRACRVLVLENSVIPAIEDAANEVLRAFPYGLQIAFATQRDLKSGDGTAETLEIEVVGPGQVYELLSGGQRTCVDLAFHVALALVVARRSTTRIRFLYLDEPEGLDEAGRLALARLVRRIHEEHALAVVVASHHEDLVEAIGGERVVIEGEPGNATVGTSVAEVAA